MDAYKQQPHFIPGGAGQRALPNATAVLVLGIISIPSCFCLGIVGIICAVIALVIAGKDKQAYNSEPQSYTRSSINNLNAGRICAIIGLILSLLYTIYTIWIINKVGWENMSNPDAIREAFGIRN